MSDNIPEPEVSAMAQRAKTAADFSINQVPDGGRVYEQVIKGLPNTGNKTGKPSPAESG